MNPIDALKSKARDWAGKVVELHKTQVPKSKQPEKDFLINSAEKIKNAIESVTGALPELAPIAQATGTMGAAPLVIAAGIAGAAGAIVWWTSRYTKLMAGVTSNREAKLFYDELIANGETPERATKMARQMHPIIADKSFSDSLAGKVAPYAVGLLVLWYMRR